MAWSWVDNCGDFLKNIPNKVGRVRAHISQAVRAKPWTFVGLLGGLLLIVLFPFRIGFDSGLIRSCGWLKWLFATADCGEIKKLIILWDAVAVVWTVFFTIIFFFGDFGSAYRASTRRVLMLGGLSVLVALFSLQLFFWGFETKIGYGNPDFHYFLGAKALPMFWILVTDALIIWGAAEIADSVKKEFWNLFVGIDLPAFVAIAILSAYSLMPPIDLYSSLDVKSLATPQQITAIAAAREFSGFASGVAASMLIYVNVAFAIQSMSVPPPPPGPAAPEQGNDSAPLGGAPLGGAPLGPSPREEPHRRRRPLRRSLALIFFAGRTCGSGKSQLQVTQSAHNRAALSRIHLVTNAPEIAAPSLPASTSMFGAVRPQP